MKGACTTALALLFGLGLALPAAAEGQQKAQTAQQGQTMQQGSQSGQQDQTMQHGQTGQHQQGQTAQQGHTVQQQGQTAQQGGQTEQQEGPVVIQGQHGQTQTSASGVSDAAGADMDADQYITGEEATAYDEQRWGEITGGAEEMTQEQFTGAMTGAQDAAASFAEVDADQSGQISADEWMQWRQQRFGEATQGSEGRMGAQDFEGFDVGGEMSQ